MIPISVEEINLAQLKQERDAIWAAAVAAYRKGESWWLDRDEEKLSAENNHRFEIVDEWQSAIANYLSGRESCSISELLQNVFEYELGQIQRRDQMRVANILTAIGCQKAGQKQHQGKRQVVWVLPSKTHTQQEMSTPAIPVESESEAIENRTDNPSQETEKVESFGVEEPKKQLIKQTTKQVRRIGWGKKQGLACIKERYGVSERAEMSVEQLIDFCSYLKNLPSK